MHPASAVEYDVKPILEKKISGLGWGMVRTFGSPLGERGLVLGSFWVGRGPKHFPHQIAGEVCCFVYICFCLVSALTAANQLQLINKSIYQSCESKKKVVIILLNSVEGMFWPLACMEWARDWILFSWRVLRCLLL